MAQGSNVVVNPDGVLEDYEKVRSEDETMWLALNYDDKSIVSIGTGETYNDLLKLFTNEERVYAYCRFTTGDEMSVRAKFVFITWIGPSVSPLKKAKVSTDKAFVKNLIKEYAFEILADEIKDLEYDEVHKRVVLSGGASY